MAKEILKIPVIALLLLLIANSAFAYVVSGTITAAGIGPLDGAVVDINIMPANTNVGSGITSGGGNYSITIADTPGAYKVGTAYSIYNTSTIVLINADKTVDLTVPATLTTLSGTVKNLCGAPLVGATISVAIGTGQLASAVTDAAGAYTASVIDSTTYNVTASAVGYISDTQVVPVAGATPKDFTLAPACADADCDGFADAACGGTDCDDTSAAVNSSIAETCNGIDDDCSGTADDGLAAPFNTNQIAACLGSKQSCNGIAGWADDYTGVAGYPDSCVASAPAPAPIVTTTSGGGGGGGGGGRGDADCKPAPVGLGIGVSGWLCSANEACIGGITWNSPHVEGGVCCNVQCTTVAAVEEETPPQEEQPAPVETPRETTNPNCNDLNPCTIDTYDSVLEVCSNSAADNDTVCYANGQSGVCDFGTCKIPSAPVAPAVAAGPTGFAVFGDFFAAISGAIGAFVQWILGLFG